jgi:hypothetical protein
MYFVLLPQKGTMPLTMDFLLCKNFLSGKYTSAALIVLAQAFL